MNLVLLLILISEICITLCAWLSPNFLRLVAAHLLTRADVIEISREQAKQRKRYWSKELNRQTSSTEEGSATIGPVHVFARR